MLTIFSLCVICSRFAADLLIMLIASGIHIYPCQLNLFEGVHNIFIG
jgi:hypothetical protein